MLENTVLVKFIQDYNQDMRIFDGLVSCFFFFLTVVSANSHFVFVINSENYAVA